MIERGFSDWRVECNRCGKVKSVSPFDDRYPGEGTERFER